MPSNEEPITPRKAFGKLLGRYRMRAGLTQAELGAKVHVVGDVISKIETGERPPARDLIPRLDALPELATNGMLAEFAEILGDGLRETAYPEWFDDWPSKEIAAMALRWFELVVVPGILQTEAYMRAIFRTRLKTTEQEIDELVAARLKRQEILARADPPMLWVIIDEAVIRRPVGGPTVMAEQLNHLVTAARRSYVVVEIIPAGLGEHLGLLGSFIIADFKDAPSVGYQEMAVGGQPLAGPEQVASLEQIWNTVRTETLSRSASLATMEEAANTWNSAK